MEFGFFGILDDLMRFMGLGLGEWRRDFWGFYWRWVRI
jgi:hypothetical protein